MPYYAVKIGKVPGIYNTWAECSENVTGFSGAKFHKFATYDDAKKFMGDAEPNDNHNPVTEGNQLPFAYVDGSYNQKTGEYSYGVVMTPDGVNMIELSGKDTKWSTMRNVAGECDAVINALRMADVLGLNELHIYHDYNGLAHWVDGTWNAGVPGVIAYVERVKSFNCKPIFHKVPAHSGVELNEQADRLAKSQIGV